MDVNYFVEKRRGAMQRRTWVRLANVKTERNVQHLGNCLEWRNKRTSTPQKKEERYDTYILVGIRILVIKKKYCNTR